jgi:predicted ArsR family transcriptional regulator
LSRTDNPRDQGVQLTRRYTSGVNAAAGAGAASADPEEAQGSARSDRRFSAAVAAVTSAFGDPTRREIYLHVRSRPATTASEVASAFSLHPNVARHHLDRLAAGGYLEVTLERSPTAGAGRPSKRYTAADDSTSDPTVELLAPRDDLLVSLLGEALTLLGAEDAERMAERVGEQFGRGLAERMEPGEGQRSLRAAMHTIADALTAHGFAAHAEDRGTSTAIVAEQCPFGEAASQHPVICAVDRGMVRGLLAGLCGERVQDATRVVLSSRARGDDACTALV